MARKLDRVYIVDVEATCWFHHLGMGGESLQYLFSDGESHSFVANIGKFSWINSSRKVFVYFFEFSNFTLSPGNVVQEKSLYPFHAFKLLFYPAVFSKLG